MLKRECPTSQHVQSSIVISSLISKQFSKHLLKEHNSPHHFEIVTLITSIFKNLASLYKWSYINAKFRILFVQNRVQVVSKTSYVL